MNVQTLSRTLFDAENLYQSVIKHEQQILSVNLEELLLHNLITYPDSYVIRNLFPALFAHWQYFAISDWVDLVRRASSYDIAIYTLTRFLTVYLHLDVIKILNSTFKDDPKKEVIIETLRKTPWAFAVALHEYDHLDDYKVSMEALEEVRIRLANDGAPTMKPLPVEVIKGNDIA
jgi:hypothetical protein